MKKFYWNGTCLEDRISGITRIRKVIDEYAVILTFKKYSDLSIGFLIEIEGMKIGTFHRQLKKIVEVADPKQFSPSDQRNSYLIFLNISFAKGTGDLKIDVPAVPG